VTVPSLRGFSRTVVCVAIAAALSACGSSPTSPSTAPFSKTDLLTGTGTDAVTGKLVTVNYTGWLYDASKADGKGVQFDTSVGRTPFSFALGYGEVIQGWDQGLPGMKVGGLRRLVIPPSLAYGSVRNGPIPPYATLVFDIELVEVADLQ
jgi:FKBP-type peptidyl-prolyl cis-trans isomerase FkpA